MTFEKAFNQMLNNYEANENQLFELLVPEGFKLTPFEILKYSSPKFCFFHFADEECDDDEEIEDFIKKLQKITQREWKISKIDIVTKEEKLIITIYDNFSGTTITLDTTDYNIIEPLYNSIVQYVNSLDILGQIVTRGVYESVDSYYLKNSFITKLKSQNLFD